MACWPANLVGAFFLALIIFDMVYQKWDNIVSHILLGLVFTGLFWGICAGISESVSGGILAVPVVFLIVFLGTAWFFNKYKTPTVVCPSEKDECAKKARVKAILVPRTDGCPPPFPKDGTPSALSATSSTSSGATGSRSVITPSGSTSRNTVTATQRQDDCSIGLKATPVI
jgi:hypothetical protein